MSTEIITKESLSKEGIDVKITQNDIIEFLISEKINTIESECRSLVNMHSEIQRELKAEIEEAAEKLALTVKLPKGLKLDRFVKDFANHKDSTKYLGVYRNEYRDVISFRENNHTFHKSFEIIISPVYCTEISGVKLSSSVDYQASVKIPFTYSDALIKRIEIHTKTVSEFLKKVPQDGISEKKLNKEIKNQFTKEFLKGMSSDFKKALRLGFNTKV